MEYPEKWPDYLERARQRANTWAYLTPNLSALQQTGAFTEAVDDVTNSDNMPFWEIMQLSDISRRNRNGHSANEFGEQEVRELYAYFADCSPHDCRYQVELLIEQIRDLRGDELFRHLIAALLGAMSVKQDADRPSYDQFSILKAFFGYE